MYGTKDVGAKTANGEIETILSVHNRDPIDIDCLAGVVFRLELGDSAFAQAIEALKTIKPSFRPL